MKKITHVLAWLLLYACTTAYSRTVGDLPSLERTHTDQAIAESVKKELGSFLENIPVSLEKEHGFNDRSEFIKALPASIYRIVGVNQEGVAFQTNLYNVAVAVNGEYRSVLLVSETNGKFEIETVGAALMAKELQAFEKVNPVATDEERIILHVYSKAASFVGNRHLNTPVENAALIPLESAKTGLENASENRALKSSYTLSEAVEALQLK